MHCFRPSPDCRGDRAIDRPKSAAGAVGRPKSSKPESLLPNGMPVLPNDLSLDAPGPDPQKPGQTQNAINFGFQPSQNSSSFSPGLCITLVSHCEQDHSNEVVRPSACCCSRYPLCEVQPYNGFKVQVRRLTCHLHCTEGYLPDQMKIQVQNIY